MWRKLSSISKNFEEYMEELLCNLRFLFSNSKKLYETDEESSKSYLILFLITCLPLPSVSL